MATKQTKPLNAFTAKPDLSKWVKDEKMRNKFTNYGSRQAAAVKTTGAGDFMLRPINEKQ